MHFILQWSVPLSVDLNYYSSVRAVVICRFSFIFLPHCIRLKRSLSNDMKRKTVEEIYLIVYLFQGSF